MTKQDKRQLIYYIRYQAGLTDKELAVLCNCSMQTVRKYRKILESGND